MAVLLTGKFLYLAHPHTASTAMSLALQDTFPDVLDLRPHHMLLQEARGESGTLLSILQHREKVWDNRAHKRRTGGPRTDLLELLPGGLGTLHTGTELVWSVVRNPYDVLVTTYLRKDRTGSFESFVERFAQPPWVVNRRLHYHAPASDMVLRYETLREDMDRLTARLGLPRIELGRHNETADKRPWETYYTPRAYQIVNERFAEDFGTHYELREE